MTLRHYTQWNSAEDMDVCKKPSTACTACTTGCGRVSGGSGAACHVPRGSLSTARHPRRPARGTPAAGQEADCRCAHCNGRRGRQTLPGSQRHAPGEIRSRYSCVVFELQSSTYIIPHAAQWSWPWRPFTGSWTTLPRCSRSSARQQNSAPNPTFGSSTWPTACSCRYVVGQTLAETRTRVCAPK